MQKTKNWRQIFIYIGLLGAIQFILLTVLAMWLYPGGTIHEPELESYSFFTNYFSDLGRTYTFDRTPNSLCHNLFKATLSITGASLILFFIAIPGLFDAEASKVCISIAALFGIAAGLCYIAIGWVPWDVDYWNHVGYVRTGFLAFLGMTIFYSFAILFDLEYPNKYAYAFLIFGLILGVQIVIMLFGPRAWRNEEALLLQAVAQKVVVYAEILVMIYVVNGALKRAV
ncbi:MAG: hypothetical protein ACI8YQ_001751 [Polaribacter sp.]|jgi:hypothetical protein